MLAYAFCPVCDNPSTKFPYELPQQDSTAYMAECVQGHPFRLNVLLHNFQKHFQHAIESLAVNREREAVLSFASSYESFLTLFHQDRHENEQCERRG